MENAYFVYLFESAGNSKESYREISRFSLIMFGQVLETNGNSPFA